MPLAPVLLPYRGRRLERRKLTGALTQQKTPRAAHLSVGGGGWAKREAPPPRTPAFWNVVNANRTTEESELQDVLDKLGNPKAVTIDQIACTSTEIGGGGMYTFREWIRDRKNRKAINHRLENCGYRAVDNPVAKKDGMWRIDERRQMVYAIASLPLGEQLKAAATRPPGQTAGRRSASHTRAAPAPSCPRQHGRDLPPSAARRS